MISGRYESTLARIRAEDWNQCLPGEIECYDYHLAVEEARVPGFAPRYFTLWDGPDMVGAAPGFRAEHRLDRSLSPGWAQRLVAPLASRLTLSMLCLGGVTAERCQVGVRAPAGSATEKALLAAMLASFRSAARVERVALLAAKDVPDDARALACAFASAGFRRLPGGGTAVLDVPRSVEDYLSALSRATRRDLKRKARVAARVTQVDALEGETLAAVGSLYRATRARSAVQFEELPDAYFRAVLRRLGPRAICRLYAGDDGRLVGFNLLLIGGDRLLDKDFAMDPAAREANLYHLSWLENVRDCAARGLPIYQPGQGFLAEKRRLGARVLPASVFYRASRTSLQRVLQAATASLAAAERVHAFMLRRGRARSLGASLWVAFLFAETGSQLAVKQLATALGTVPPDGGIAEYLAMTAVSPWFWAAILGYFAAFACWTAILRRSALGEAFLASGAVLVLVLLSSWLFLGEVVPPRRWAGAATILIGLKFGRAPGNNDARGRVCEQGVA